MGRDSAKDAVTVVIPVWDEYVRFLPEAVESVRADSPDAVVVVVDNASTVPVPELDGVRLVRAPERLSVGDVRNLGVEQVETPYLLVLDADDRLLPGTLELLRSRLEADPSLAICATLIIDGETGERHRFPRRFVPSLTRFPRAFALIDAIWSLVPIQGCAMMRTTQVREAGGYPDASWGDDWVLAVSLAFRGRVEIAPHLGRYYRHTPDSLWRRPRSAPELMASARLVRRRMRGDSAIPSWARALVPLVAALQFGAVYLLRPPYLLARRIRGLPTAGDVDEPRHLDRG